MIANQGAAPDRRPAGRSEGSGNLFATIAADRAIPAADNLMFISPCEKLGGLVWIPPLLSGHKSLKTYWLRTPLSFISEVASATF